MRTSCPVLTIFFVLLCGTQMTLAQGCGNVHKEQSGTVSYARLTNETEACQWILDISPMSKLRLEIRKILDDVEYEAAVYVYRVNPDNENTPLQQAVLLTPNNGSYVQISGNIFIITYYEDKPEGKGFILDFEGSLPMESRFSTENQIIRNPNRTMSTSTHQFLPNQFTTVLVRGPIFRGGMSSYLGNIILQYYEVKENCGKCILTISKLYEDVESSDDIRSFYGSSKYPITYDVHAFAPMVVTVKREGGVEHGLNFKLDWIYY